MELNEEHQAIAEEWCEKIRKYIGREILQPVEVESDTVD